MEIHREYRDASGATITQVKLGQDIEVHIQVRSLNSLSLDNIVIVDLLPGGFEVISDSLKSDNVDYIDAREDRVIFFASVSPDAKEIVYRIKATNTGKFVVPPATASSMYDPNVLAHDVFGTISVENA